MDWLLWTPWTVFYLCAGWALAFTFDVKPGWRSWVMLFFWPFLILYVASALFRDRFL